MKGTLKTRVERRLAELDRNPFEAARIGGLERSFINDIIIEKKTSVRGENINKLAAALDWTIEDVLGAGGKGVSSKPPKPEKIYSTQLEDSACIQVSVGNLRRAVTHTLRRGKIPADRATALAHVLVAALVEQSGAALVVPIGETGRTPAGSRAPGSDDQS